MISKNYLHNYQVIINAKEYKQAKKMKTIGLEENKIELSEIVAQVSEGNEYTITKNGIPVALITPINDDKSKRIDAQNAIKRAKELRKKLFLGDLEI